MKLRTHRLFPRILSRRGYTIDQTILIVAIIAILITLIIVTVGWQLINRTGGTKAAAQLKQVEDANGQFYSQHKTWPHLALTGAANNATPENNILAISSYSDVKTKFEPGAIKEEDLRNLLPGSKVVSGVVYHTFGNGTGTITQQAMKFPSDIGDDLFMVVQFTKVPWDQAKEADINIDGNPDAAKGRVIFGTGNCLSAGSAYSGTPTTATGLTAASGGLVTVCYAANTVQ